MPKTKQFWNCFISVLFKLCCHVNLLDETAIFQYDAVQHSQYSLNVFVRLYKKTNLCSGYNVDFVWTEARFSSPSACITMSSAQGKREANYSSSKNSLKNSQLRSTDYTPLLVSILRHSTVPHIQDDSLQTFYSFTVFTVTVRQKAR